MIVDIEKAARDALTYDAMDYLPRGRSLLKRYKSENCIRLEDQDVDPRGFAAWLKTLRPFLGWSTWRVYRRGAEAIMLLAPREARKEAWIILNTESGT